MKLRVPAERTAVLLIPVEAASRILPGGKLRLMIYDGKASQTLEVPVEEQRFIRSGECAALERVTAGKAAADDPFRAEFRVSATKEAFCLDIQIRDSVRGRLLSAASIARIHSVCFFQPERRANLRVWMFWVM